MMLVNIMPNLMFSNLCHWCSIVHKGVCGSQKITNSDMPIFFPSLLVCVAAGKSQTLICRFSQFSSVCGCWKITNSDMPIFSVFKCVWLLENHKLRYADFFLQFPSVCGCWKITNSDMPIFFQFSSVRGSWKITTSDMLNTHSLSIFTHLVQI